MPKHPSKIGTQEFHIKPYASSTAPFCLVCQLHPGVLEDSGTSFICGLACLLNLVGSFAMAEMKTWQKQAFTLGASKHYSKNIPTVSIYKDCLYMSLSGCCFRENIFTSFLNVYNLFPVPVSAANNVYLYFAFHFSSRGEKRARLSLSVLQVMQLACDWLALALR